MKLWRIEKGVAHDPLLVVDEDNRLIISGNHQAYCQQICDEHNAWVILAERGWTVEKNSNDKWIVRVSKWVIGAVFRNHKDREHDTPVAAIRAADAWLSERKGAK